MGDQDYLRDGVTRAERILGALAAHPAGLSATEIADLTENPGHMAMIRCSGKLEELRWAGWVAVAGIAKGRSRYPGRAVRIWRLPARYEEIKLISCAAEEMNPAQVGILARIALQARDRERAGNYPSH